QLAGVPPHPAGPHATARKLFSFGAIADVQYANTEDGWNWDKTARRYFRGGLVQLRRAVDTWLQDERHSFVLQLGDCIDGKNRPDSSDAALRDVRLELDRLGATLPLGVVSTLGNHELYNFPKERWARELNCSNLSLAAKLRPPGAFPPSGAADQPSVSSKPPPALAGCAETAVEPPDGRGRNGGGKPEDKKEEERFYFSFCPHATYRFVGLDPYDLNVLWDGEETGVDGTGSSTDYLSKRNPNADKNNSSGLDGVAQRFVEYNGGVGPQQLLWIEHQLADASRAGQRVVIFSHLPIHPGTGQTKCLIWNFDEVLAVLHKFDCVALCVSGHTHKNAYHRDCKGIHHVSLAAALETPLEQEAFASVDVYVDKLEVRGHGSVESRTILLPGRVGKLLVG
ncbi:unnamed protein product, partial [Sphacelaria rigidula]